MRFTLGEAESTIDYNYVTDRLLFSTFGGTSFTAGNPEVLEMWFSNGYTLRIISEKGKDVRINMVAPATKPKR